MFSHQIIEPNRLSGTGNRIQTGEISHHQFELSKCKLQVASYLFATDKAIKK